MTTPDPDYDAWAEETPEPADRLTDLVTQLADYAGLTIAPEHPAPHSGQPVNVSVRCGACDVTQVQAVVVQRGQSVIAPGVHLCGAPLGDGVHSLFSFTITAGR